MYLQLINKFNKFIYNKYLVVACEQVPESLLAG